MNKKSILVSMVILIIIPFIVGLIIGNSFFNTESKELEILEVLKSSKKFDDAEITNIASKIGIQEKATTTNDAFFIAQSMMKCCKL